MAGQQRGTGTRPKTNRNAIQNDQDERSDDSSTYTDASNLRDLASLLRDHELMKDNISLLQQAVQNNSASADNISLMQQPTKHSSTAPSPLNRPSTHLTNPTGHMTQPTRVDLESQPSYRAEQSNENRHNRVGVNQLGRSREHSYLTQDLQRTKRENQENSSGEVEILKNRLRELQEMVLQVEAHEPNNPELNTSRGSEINPADNRSDNLSRLSYNRSRAQDDICESDSELVERNLAFLTAQYEKNQEEEQSSYPPSMGLINRWREDNQSSPLARGVEQSSLLPEQSSLLPRGADQSSLLSRGMDHPRSLRADQIHDLANLNQRNLERELKEKREQLELLMKKSIVSANINESGLTETKSLGNPRLQRKELNRALSSSRLRPPLPPARNLPRETATNTMAQHQNINNLVNLQEEVQKLSTELERLALRSTSPVPQQTNSNTQSQGVVYTVPLELQMQQLALSVNQIYQVMFGLQREVSSAVERLAALETRNQPPHTFGQPSTFNHAPLINSQSWNQGAEGIMWPDGDASWTEGVPTWTQDPPLDLFSPFPPRELWNSLQNSPGFNNLASFHEPQNLNLLSAQQSGRVPGSDLDSGVSSGALNNQVSPGMRANNYYDNFRSFSRQNRFSTPPTASGAGNGGRRQAESLPANNTASGYNRTRKKYKINREQNRDPNGGGRKRQQTNQSAELETNAASNRIDGVNVYNSPTESGRDLRTDHSSIDNLTKNIYSQVQSIIQRNEKAPELLANLLDDLTFLGDQQNVNISPFRREERDGLSRREDRREGNVNIDVAESSSMTSDEGANRFNHRSSRSKVGSKRLPNQPPSSLHLQGADHDSSDTGLQEAAGFGGESNYSSGHNLNLSSAGFGGESNYSSGHNLNLSSSNQQSSHQPSPSIYNNSSDSRRSSNQTNQSKSVIYVPNSFPSMILNPLPSTSSRQASSPSLVSSSTIGSHSQPGWSNNSHSYAVPKNQQKNLMSRERDSRRMPGWQERGLPRNMQSGESSTASNEPAPAILPMGQRAPDQDGFINVQLQLPVTQADIQEPTSGGPPQDSELRTNRPSQSDPFIRPNQSDPFIRPNQSDLTEAELAEADQVGSSAPENKLIPSRQEANRDPDSLVGGSSSHIHHQSPGHQGLHQSPGHQVPMMVGLDRVPIRLQASHGGEHEARRQLEDGGRQHEARRQLEDEGRQREARRQLEDEGSLHEARRQLEDEGRQHEARRQLEDEAVASIVEEVLASSPELVSSISDNLPNPPELN